MAKLTLKETPKSNQNWLFNILKILFAICIILGHTIQMVGEYKSVSTYVFADGFLFISGLFLYKTATTKKTNTFKYMWHKYLNFLPAIIFGAIVAYIVVLVRLSGSWNWSEFGIRTGKFFLDLIPVQLVYYNNQDYWFFVVLLWGCFLLYPLVKKLPKVMPWVCLGLFLSAYIYNVVAIGCAEPFGIIAESNWNTDIWLFCRGIAGLSTGIFIAGLSDLVKLKSENKTAQTFHTIAFVCLLIAAITIAFGTYHTYWDFIIILCLQIMCFMGWNKMTYLNANRQLNFPTILAGWSMYIYVCHHRLNELTLKYVTKTTFDWRFTRLILVTLVALAVSLVVFVIVRVIKKQIAIRKTKKPIQQKTK